MVLDQYFTALCLSHVSWIEQEVPVFREDSSQSDHVCKPNGKGCFQLMPVLFWKLAETGPQGPPVGPVYELHM